MSFKTIPITGKLGFGTMSLTARPVPIPVAAAIETLKYVTNDLKVTYLNGGEFYGPNSANLKLFQNFLAANDAENSKNLVVSIKGALENFAPCGDEASIQKSIENVLLHFNGPNRPKLLFECARVDPNVPIEDSIGYIAQYVKEGKLDGISLSEVGIESIRKAQKVFPISCVELEFSILSQEIVENGILQELGNQNIPLIAYSPLGRGLLTDHAVETADTYLDSLPAGSYLKMMDRFSEENFPHNIKLCKQLYDFAHNKKNTSLEALAISWLVKISESSEFQGVKNLPKIVPIPSGSSREKVDKNFNHLVDLTEDDLAEIQEIVTETQVKGGRYNEHFRKYLLQ